MLGAALSLVACDTSSDDPSPGQPASSSQSAAASTGGAGGAGSGAAADGGSAGHGAGSGGGGLEGPMGEWVFHEVPGAICANGSPTGLGVNRGAGNSVVVYMSGGSACLDAGCSIGTPSMRKDGGFGPAEMASCAAGDCDGSVTFPSQSIFDRSSSTNPFADATHVFVSNCAGDYYVGDNVHQFPDWTAHFRGWNNQALFAAAVAAGLPDATRVIVTGGSAGAVGAMLNYGQWVEALAGTRVDLISDSFAFVYEDGPQWRYDLHNPQVPAGCDGCIDDYRSIYAHNAALAPGARIAVLDSEDNWTLDLVAGDYTAGLEALQPQLARLANVRYHVANGNEHILMQHPLDSAQVDVVRPGEDPRLLSDFLAAMQSDATAWESQSCLGP